MSKSKGTGISPDELLSKFPVDTIRLWAALGSAIGKNKPFLYNDVDYAKSFITKLWNSAMFVKNAMAEIGIPKVEPKKDLGIFDIWILNRLNTIIKQAENAYENFNFYEVASTVMNFYWHEFADYYIENVKHRVYSEDRKMAKSRHAAAFTLERVLFTTLALLAPIMPHAAEEVYSLFKNQSSIFNEKFPVHKVRSEPSDYVINGVVFRNELIEIDYEDSGAFINTIIAAVRTAKAKNRLALNKETASININVPEEYYRATDAAKDELARICKAKEVKVARGVYSVEVKI